MSKQLVIAIIVKATMLLMAGFCVAIGIRIGEWVIYKPEMRVIVCMASDIPKIETCQNAADLLNKR